MLIFIGLFIYFILPVLDGKPFLALGGSSDIISIWNLEKKRLQLVVREAHDSVITSLHFVANEPVPMSSSTDNSVNIRTILKLHTCIHVIKFFDEPYMLGEYSECNFRWLFVQILQKINGRKLFVQLRYLKHNG